MHPKTVIVGSGQYGITPYSLLSSVMVTAAQQKKRFTPEQRVEIEKHRQTFREQRIRQAQIIQNICPDCEGKLKRGKKEKKNNYKRAWHCQDCGHSHSL